MNDNPEHTHGEGNGPVLGGTPDCEAALAEVYTYLDEELSVIQYERVLAHLHTCTPCHEAFDFEAEFRMVVAAKAQSDVFPEGLRLRIIQRIQEFGIVGDDGQGEGSFDGGGDSGTAGGRA